MRNKQIKEGKGKVAHKPRRPTVIAGAYPDFFSMKQLRVLLLQPDGILVQHRTTRLPVPIHTPGSTCSKVGYQINDYPVDSAIQPLNNWGLGEDRQSGVKFKMESIRKLSNQRQKPCTRII